MSRLFLLLATPGISLLISMAGFAAAPSVANLPAAGIGYTVADVRGEVTDTGGLVPEVTLYFGEEDGGDIEQDWSDAVVLGAQSGVFSSALFALSADTTYYYRVFAANSDGEAWASESATFQTLAYNSPSVVTEPASNVTGSAARLGGRVASTGGNAPVITLYWGTEDGGTDPLAWEGNVVLGPQSASFSTVITGLSPQTTYHVRAFAENEAGSDWGEGSLAFSTSDTSALVISEFMALNDGGQSNNDNSWWPISNQVAGTTDDWIEIHNAGPSGMDLGGWHLTDRVNDLRQWTFPPNTLLEAGGYLVVYASGRGAPDARGNLHTNFALSASGEYVALVRPGGGVASEFGPAGSSYPSQDEDVSYGMHPISSAAVYFSSPTPGSANSNEGVARVADTKFSPDRGYYPGPLEVTITSSTPGARIYYTTDGTPPLNANGGRAPGAVLYDGPVLVDRTLPLRAGATAQGLQSSDVDSHTYILLDIEGAAADGRDPAGVNMPFLSQRMPRNWGTLASGDYNMDPDISRSTSSSRGHDGLSVAQAMLAGMRDIPTISIAMDRNDFAGGNGIYSNPQSRGFAWERDCSAEFIPAAGDWRKDWGETCGLRVQGGASRTPSKSPKHSLSFRFRAEYGVGKLRQELFEGSPVSEFNVIALRAGYNNSWIHSDSGQRQRGSMIRDQWARESIFDMGHPDAGRGFMVHLFINGLYWGVHNLCERQDASHYAAYNGGDENALDARNGSDVIDGDSTAWNEMKSVVSTRRWSRIQGVLDVDTYIDYQIVHRFGGNADLKTNGNWRAAGGGPFDPRRPDQMAPWKVFSWDGERILESPSSTTVPLDPLGIRSSLDATPEYRVRFADRLQKHFFNDGALTPEACKARWMKFATPLDRAIIAESARWGDHRRGTPYSRRSEWLQEQRRLCDTYFPVRTANVLNRYRSEGFYPAFDAPGFEVGGRAQHGGVITAGQALTVEGTGTIYVTLDGSDPRREGGAVNPNAIELSAGAELSLPASGLVRVRSRRGADWSALEEATFYLERLARPGDVMIEELNYHPAPASAREMAEAAGLAVPVDLANADCFEFVELRNVSEQAVNLDGVRFAEGIDYRFGNLVLGPQEFAVVVNDSTAFSIRYPGVAIAGEFAGNLANDGERVLLAAQDGAVAEDFRYNDAGDWPFRADGFGSSLEAVRSDASRDDADSWRASSEFHGSPGAEGSGPDGRIVINEVRTHSLLPVVDEIELHNLLGTTVDVSGWLLADSARQFKSFAIADSTVMPGHGYLRLDEGDFNSPQDLPINGYSGVVASAPTRVTTNADHGLTTGDLVTISGYGGIGNYNRSFEVTVIDATNFEVPAVFLDDNGSKGVWSMGRPFALNSAHGDEVWLLEADPAGNPVRFIDYVSFDGAFEGDTLGRWPDGGGSGNLVTMTWPTFGEENSGPRVGPVIISELMYQPANGSEELLEFVEICNVGTMTESLENWRLRGGADFEFTASHELAPGEVLVVVPFNPALDTSSARSFRLAYGIAGDTPLVGPFLDGPLRNDRGSVRLQRPDASPPGEAGFFPSVTVDVIDYFSSDPWPAKAAGGGDSLTRVAVGEFGRFSSSWAASPASPGRKVASGYDEWRDLVFGEGAPAGSGPLEDFDLDGLRNLLEWAIGSDPIVFDSDSPITLAVADGEASLSYPKDTSVGGIDYRVEKSVDLVNWEFIPDELVSSNGTIEIRKASVSLAAHARAFLRLSVELR